MCEHPQNSLKCHSTESALIVIRLVDQHLMDFDNNRVSELIFVGYKKAFELIDHQLLLQKLEIHGVQRNELKLFCNYLSDRLQYVNIDGNRSSSQRVIFHVLQGSILGHILFLLDLPSEIQILYLTSTSDLGSRSESKQYRPFKETRLDSVL